LAVTNWTNEELTTIGDAEELRIASLRRDGTVRPFVTIWVDLLALTGFPVVHQGNLVVELSTSPGLHGVTLRRREGGRSPLQ
jgi:hypothetical protein